MMANKSSSSKEELALSLLKIVIDGNAKSEPTKESVVEIYNYIYDNLHISTDEVVIINNIPRDSD